MNYFLGIDGGQTHTTALIADAHGRIVGRGQAGPSNHTREAGGRQRLARAVRRSVEIALRQAGLLVTGQISDFKFRGAHLAMTGEPEEKIQIIELLLQADHLVVAHDAPAALAGALAGDEGIIVLAGTGSVAYGKTQDGRTAQVGGHGYLFGDEGSAFAVARQALSLALWDGDRAGHQIALKEALLDHFKRDCLRAIAQDFYAGIISRDCLASFSMRLGRLAAEGNQVAKQIFRQAAEELAEMAQAVALRLGIATQQMRVSYSGGVFKNELLLNGFRAAISERLLKAEVIAPQFTPEFGALLLAFQGAGRRITERLIKNLKAGVKGSLE